MLGALQGGAPVRDDEARQGMGDSCQAFPQEASSAGGAYVNMMMDKGRERVKAAYHDNYDRLVEVKNKYDPANFFHVNQNIRPAA